MAIIVHLALAGPTRRELLADLLWDRADNASNLRVELHHIRAALLESGLSTSGLMTDPLRLPGGIEPDSSGTGLWLAGLEGQTPELDDWLDVQRFGLERKARDDLAGKGLLDHPLEPGMVAILSVQPGTSGMALAESFARKHGLRVERGVEPSGRILHYLGDARQHSPEIASRVAEDLEGIWVLKHVNVAEEPEMLLTLRASLTADRVRFIKVAPYDWTSAAGGPLSQFGFARAAEMFLESAGHRGYLDELLRQADQRRGRSVPQRIRASYLLEVHRLSDGAQRALEFCAVADGRLQEEQLDGLNIGEHMDELERQNWLTFDGDWSFADITAKKVVAESVRPGSKLRFQKLLSQITRSTAPQMAEVEAGHAYGLDGSAPGVNAVSLVGAPEVHSPKSEIDLLEAATFGPGVACDLGKIVMARQGADDAPSGVEWQLTGARTLVRIEGRSHTARGSSEPNPFASKNACPLLEVYCVTSTRQGSSRSRAGSRQLELQPELDCWLEISEGDVLRVECSSPQVVIELQVSAYRTSSEPWADLESVTGEHSLPAG